MCQQRVWMPLPQVAGADTREAALDCLSFPASEKNFSESHGRQE
jgi:hypothetical protein